MKNLSFQAVNSYVSHYPAVRPVEEIAVWTWIAGAILVVLVLAALLVPRPDMLASGTASWEQLAVPPITQSAPLSSDIAAGPNL